MGTDVSMYAEVRWKGRWHLAEPLEQANLSLDGIDGLKPKEIYSTRCYALFAILADVMNPMRAIEPFDCISKPRGFPLDASDELRDWYSNFQGAVFAESWLLLRELLDFDWHGKRIHRRGVVDGNIAHLFRSGRFPPPSEWPNGQIGVADQGVGVEVKWIDTYADEGFGEAVRRVIAITDAVVRHSPPTAL